MTEIKDELKSTERLNEKKNTEDTVQQDNVQQNESNNKDETKQDIKTESKQDVKTDSESVNDGEPRRKYKAKKVVRKRKSVGKTDPLEQAIRLTLESGKVIMGYRQSLNGINSKKVKAVLVASTARKDVIDGIKNVSNATKTPVFEYKGTTLKLGTICGKPYSVSVLSITDEGTSDILGILNGQDN